MTDVKELADRPAINECEIVVTPEMIEAGVSVLYDYSHEDGIAYLQYRNVVCDIYRLMLSKFLIYSQINDGCRLVDFIRQDSK